MNEIDGIYFDLYKKGDKIKMENCDNKNGLKAFNKNSFFFSVIAS